MHGFNILIGSNGKIGEPGGTQTNTQDFIAYDISLTNFSHYKFENGNFFFRNNGFKGSYFKYKISIGAVLISN